MPVLYGNKGVPSGVSLHMQIQWRLVGFLIQTALVAAVLAVPMLYPEIIAVTLPKIGITLQAPARPPVVATAQTHSQSTSTTVVPTVARRYVSAPRSWNNPIAAIVDAPSGDLLPSIGPPSVFASTATIIGTIAPPPIPAPKPKPAPEPEVKRINVGGSVQSARLLNQVRPVYPALAKQARIQGQVRLEAIIAGDGSVQQLRVVSGHPLLTKAALEAVQQWRYQATLLNNRPVEVLTVIDVNFVLAQ